MTLRGYRFCNESNRKRNREKERVMFIVDRHILYTVKRFSYVAYVRCVRNGSDKEGGGKGLVETVE